MASKIQSFINNWESPIYFLLSLILFSLLIMFLLKNKSPAKLLIILASGIACFALANTSKFESFTLSPTKIEATMTKANTTLDLANAMLNRVNKLSILEASILVRSLSDRAFQHNGGSLQQDRDDDRMAILNSMRENGFSQDDVKSVALAAKDQVADQFIYALFARHLNKMSDKDQNDFDNLIGMGARPVPTPDAMEEALRRYKITDPEDHEIIKDYRYFLNTGDFRRPDWWANRSKHVPGRTG